METSQLLSCLTWIAQSLPPGGHGNLVLPLGSRRTGFLIDCDHVQANLAAISSRCGLELMDGKPGEGSLGIRAPGPWGMGCELFRLQRVRRPPRWLLTNLDTDGYEAFAALFGIVFGKSISKALWHWKYAEGRGHGVAAWHGERLIAHYGGSWRRVVAFGQHLAALQVCDAMVAVEERAVMTKTGAFFQVAAAFLELYQGLAGVPLAFGFPNHRAMRLGERLGLYAEVGSLRELRWPPLPGQPRLDSCLSIFPANLRDDRLALEILWGDMAGDLAEGIIGVRDWDFVCRRYLHHPERHYTLVMVRRRLTAAPLGLLVLHREDSAAALVDLVAPLRRIPLLVAQARRLARLWGCSSLYTWITSQHVHRFASPGAVVKDIGVRIPTNAWVAQPFTPEELHDRWWLTMGDTDFL